MKNSLSVFQTWKTVFKSFRLKDNDEEDCGSGTEADNDETEEEGNYDSEYDQEYEDREK